MPRGSGDHHPDALTPGRHREQPGAVRGEQRAGLEVAAHRDEAVAVRLDRRRELPRRRVGLRPRAGRTRRELGEPVRVGGAHHPAPSVPEAMSSSSSCSEPQRRRARGRADQRPLYRSMARSASTRRLQRCSAMASCRQPLAARRRPCAPARRPPGTTSGAAARCRTAPRSRRDAAAPGDPIATAPRHVQQLGEGVGGPGRAGRRMVGLGQLIEGPAPQQPLEAQHVDRPGRQVAPVRPAP